VNYNLKELKNMTTAFEEIPEARYILTIVEATPGKSDAGNDKIGLKFKIKDGEFKNRVVWDTLTFSQNTMWRVRKFIEVANPDLFKNESAPLAVIAEELVGCEVDAFLEAGKDLNQNPRSNPKEYIAVGETKTKSSLLS
jgi:hypothetical protein